MKLTVEISTGDLKRLRESGSLEFVLPVQDGVKAQRVKLFSVWKNPYLYQNDPKEREKKLKELGEVEQKLINSDVGNIEVEVPSVYEVKFRVIEIKPSDRDSRYY